MQTGIIAAALALVATTTLASASAECSNHGQLSCACPVGFTGNRCQTPIDWCAVARTALLGASSVCGHGQCISNATNGASCHCYKGWKGPNCNIPIPGQNSIATRCYRVTSHDGAQPTGSPPANVEQCPSGHKCVLDDMNCFLQNTCKLDYSLGWCVPIEEKNALDQAFHQLKAAAEQQNLAQFAAFAGCQNGGTPSCACDPGYTGPQCSQPIDFCKESGAPIINGPGPASGVCGAHGNCTSSTAGLSCICEQGWSGQFCQDHDKKVHISKRCTLYVTNATRLLGLTKAGCGTLRERCLTDRLNCGFQACTAPIGWCSPSDTRDAAVYA